MIALVGTTGDSYDNTLAEAVNVLYKYEVIGYFKADWTGVKDVDLATLEWIVRLIMYPLLSLKDAIMII